MNRKKCSADKTAEHHRLGFIENRNKQKCNFEISYYYYSEPMSRFCDHTIIGRNQSKLWENNYNRYL